jgi:hypothetical protein
MNVIVHVDIIEQHQSPGDGVFLQPNFQASPAVRCAMVRVAADVQQHPERLFIKCTASYQIIKSLHDFLLKDDGICAINIRWGQLD